VLAVCSPPSSLNLCAQAGQAFLPAVHHGVAGVAPPLKALYDGDNLDIRPATSTAASIWRSPSAILP